MEKIEQEIAKVNSDIETVTKQIEASESILEKEYENWIPKEKNKYGNHEQLREKENKLREEKNKLREKENKLREEKNKLNDILLEKEKQRTQSMLEPVIGRSFENTFRISFIKALFNEGKGVAVSTLYFDSKIASRRYSNKTDPELMNECRERLKTLQWEENLLKFEDIEIDCVLRCYIKEGCSWDFAEPAKLLLPKNLNKCGVITRKISENSIDGELETPNGYIVVEITSKSEKLDEKLVQLEKHLLFLLLRHQKEQILPKATIQSIISFVFLIIPYSPMKKSEMDSLIQKSIEEKMNVYPLLFSLYSFGLFGRYFTQLGGTAVFTEMSRHISENASSAHESSQLSLEIKSMRMKSERVDILTKELIVARLLPSVPEMVAAVARLEKELARIIIEDNPPEIVEME